MGIGKRQLVLASLVVALGAAVYLNWQFSGDNQLLATDALTSHKELGAAQLVNGTESSLLESAPEGSAPETDSSAPADGTGDSSSAVTTSVTPDQYFTEARLNRQKSRDQSVELMEKVLTDAGTDDAARKEAVAQAANIAENVIQESNIENLIKAKGFADCMVFLQNKECSVVVKSNGLLPNEAIAIKDIINGQSGVAYDKIKIVEAKG